MAVLSVTVLWSILKGCSWKEGFCTLRLEAARSSHTMPWWTYIPWRNRSSPLNLMAAWFTDFNTSPSLRNLICHWAYQRVDTWSAHRPTGHHDPNRVRARSEVCLSLCSGRGLLVIKLTKLVLEVRLRVCCFIASLFHAINWIEAWI